MKARMLRALPSTGDRLRAGALLLVALVFLIALARNLIGAIEANTEISRLRDENAALALRAEALTAERILLDDAAFLDLVARGYNLGSPVERPFVLAADASELPADAPAPLSAALVPLPRSAHRLMSGWRFSSAAEGYFSGSPKTVQCHGFTGAPVSSIATCFTCVYSSNE